MMGEVRLDGGIYGQMAFRTQENRKKTGHRMAAKGMEFPFRWSGGTISTNRKVIWEMSDKVLRLKLLLTA